MQQIRTISSAVILLLLFSACDGGSGSNSTQKENEPPVDDPAPGGFSVDPPSDDFEPSCELQVLPETGDIPSQGDSASPAEDEAVTAENTGYLVDAPVEGLTYSTATINGVTGLDGSFHYEDGETVRFTLGDTLVGEVSGKARVSPFDLAGSPVITGMEEINSTLKNESDPFHAVINIAVFLQSLDIDGEPENGIEITPSVAALFDGVQLNLRQDWRTFPREYWLLYALGQANGRQLFSKSHWIIDPGIAIDHLYRTLQVDARTFGQNWEQFEDEGRVDVIRIMRYDAGGNLTLREASSIDGRVSESESWTYDDRGNPTTSESHQYADESIVTSEFAPNGSLLRVVTNDGGGQPEQMRVYEYDSDGNRTRQEWTGFEGESNSRSVWQYVYDQDGRLSRVEQQVLEIPGEELQPVTTTYSYDAAGRLSRLESSGDLLGMTAEALDFSEHQYMSFATTLFVTYEYSADGHLIGRVMEGSNPQWGWARDISRFNERGDAAWNRMQVESGFIGDSDEVNAYEYEYDSRGNITLRITDHQADGGQDLTETWQYDYDTNGNVTRVVANVQEYREPHATIYSYDGRNNVIRREFYEYYDEDSDAPTEITEYAYKYYTDGGIARAEERNREEEHRHSMSAWFYDAIGRLVREEHDQGIDGVNDAVGVYEYDDCGIQVFRQTHTQDESDHSTEHWVYDTAGNLRSHEWTNTTIGAPDFPDDLVQVLFGGFESTGFKKWQYDQQGKLTRFQVDCEGACIIDLYDLNVDDERLVVNYKYDDLGNKIRELLDVNVDGWADSVDSYEYDASGNLVRASHDDSGDGTQDSIVAYSYDANGKLVLLEEDHDGDGSAEQVTSNEYDAAGNLLKEVIESSDDGRTETEIRRYQYDNNGNLTRLEEDVGGDGNPDRIEIWEYNQQGNLVREAQDYDADGTPEDAIVYQYDERGNLVREARSENEDEPPGWLATYDYDAYDNLIAESEGEDWDRDGNMDLLQTRTYESTGWGHILGNPVNP